MVKGLSRRVVIVKSPDQRIFEEAIFIVREEFLEDPEANRKEVMREALSAAGNYVGSRLGKKPRRFSFRLSAPIAAAISAVAAAVTWLAARLIGS